MAQADTAAYHAAMAELRAQTPITSVSGGLHVKHKDAELSGSDAFYFDRCTQAWLDVQGDDSRRTLDLAFPFEYFKWCQKYLLVAISKKPGASSSAEFKVCWALDVWCHVHYALFALNVNWSAASPRWGDQALAGTAYVPQGQALLAMGLKLFDAKAATAALAQLRLNALSDGERASVNPQIFARMKAAQISPFAWSFVETLLPWCTFAYSRGPRNYNKLWPRLLEALQPWRSDFGTLFQRQLPSKGGKDAGDLRAYAADPPLLYGAMQWRLFSALDHNTQWRTGMDPSRTLRGAGLGVLSDTVTLSRFIRAVGSAPRSAGAFYVETADAGSWFPSFELQLDKLLAQADGIIDLDYRRAISKYFECYVRVHLPPVKPDGTPETNAELVKRLGKDAPREHSSSDTALARCPVTYEDWWLLWKKATKEITERYQAALKDPASACERLEMSGAAKKACKQAYSKMYSVPVVKQLSGAMGQVGSFIVGLVGGAIGAYDDPFYVLENPFGRNLVAPTLRFATDCSTPEYGVRLGVARTRAEELNPGLFSSTSGPTVFTPAHECKTYFYGENSTPCSICEGQPPPLCSSELGPSYTGPRYGASQHAAPVRSVGLFGPEPPPDVVRGFRALMMQWVADNAQYGECLGRDLGAEATNVWVSLSTAVYNKKLTFEQGVVGWAGYVTSKCGVRLPPALPREHDGFLSRLLVPVNPARWLGFGG